MTTEAPAASTCWDRRVSRCSLQHHIQPRESSYLWRLRRRCAGGRTGCRAARRVRPGRRRCGCTRGRGRSAKVARQPSCSAWWISPRRGPLWRPRRDGPTEEIPGMVKLATFLDPDGEPVPVLAKPELGTGYTPPSRPLSPSVCCGVAAQGRRVGSCLSRRFPLGVVRSLRHRWGSIRTAGALTSNTAYCPGAGATAVPNGTSRTPGPRTLRALAGCPAASPGKLPDHSGRILTAQREGGGSEFHFAIPVVFGWTHG